MFTKLKLISYVLGLVSFLIGAQAAKEPSTNPTATTTTTTATTAADKRNENDRFPVFLSGSTAPNAKNARASELSGPIKPEDGHPGESLAPIKSENVHLNEQ